MGKIQASCADSGTSNVKFHVVTKDRLGWKTVCGADSSGTTLMSSATVDADQINPEWRCQKTGCRRAFASATDAALQNFAINRTATDEH